ncbi:unnamed protein product, partial [Musa textilis]
STISFLPWTDLSVGGVGRSSTRPDLCAGPEADGGSRRHLLRPLGVSDPSAGFFRIRPEPHRDDPELPTRRSQPRDHGEKLLTLTVGRTFS